MLEDAEVIFWIGESLETFMEKPLVALGSRARVVEVMRAPGMALLPGRLGGAWDGPDRDAHGRDEHAEHGPGGDAHLWLDPANARAIARLAAAELGVVDPGNRARYVANAEMLVARIDAIDDELRKTLAPVRGSSSSSSTTPISTSRSATSCGRSARSRSARSAPRGREDPGDPGEDPRQRCALCLQ